MSERIHMDELEPGDVILGSSRNRFTPDYLVLSIRRPTRANCRGVATLLNLHNGYLNEHVVSVPMDLYQVIKRERT